MRPNASKFRVYSESTKQDKYWANYADENILLLTAQRKPWADLTDPVMQYVSTAAPGLVGKRTPLQDFLKGSGRVRTISEEYIKWRLRGTGEVQAMSYENLNEGIIAPGIGGAIFSLKLDVEWFVVGDVLAADIAKDIQVIVQDSEPIGDGSGFIYGVVLVDKNPAGYFPVELLAAGTKWIKIDSVYGEASSRYGSTIFGGGSYIEFETNLTSYGKSFTVTDKAHNLNLRVQSCDDAGNPLMKYPDQIISYMEAEFLAQAKWEKEMRLFYGRSAGNDITDDSSGYHRRVGPGLLEFLEDGNIIPYSTENGSIDQFEEFLNAIWFDRVDYGNRNIVMYTGTGGLQLWNNWLTEKFAINPVMMKQEDVSRGGAKTYGPGYEGRTLGTSHFTEYQSFPWGHISVQHWPILDSMQLNGSLLHPRTGLPLSSYEFILMDYGLGNGLASNNVELIKKADSEVYTYICGVWSPSGPINSRSGAGRFHATHPGRSYDLMHADTYGLRVKDVTLTAWFKPNITN